MKKIGIIGAGLSSLYAACLLGKHGYSVDVFEKNSMSGGRSQTFSAEGFTFDMGPSWYWMPDQIDRLFLELGEKREDYYKLTRLDPGYQVFWKNHPPSNIPASPVELNNLFNEFESDGGKKLASFLDAAKTKYDIATTSFLENPGLKWSELAKLNVLKDALKLDVFKSVSKDVAKRFSSHRAQNILNFPVLFLGEMPSNIPSLYTLMNYADLKLGTWYPEKGMNAIASALEKIALKHDVTFHFNSKVEAIIEANKKATGIKVDGKKIDFDGIIGGGDYHHIEQELIPEKFRRYSEGYWDNRRMAPSSLIFYLGVNKKLEGLEHHNLFFDEDLDQHGKEIYNDPKWPSKPLFYACVPSLTDLEVAPKGKENIFILIPLAPGLKDTEEMREKYFSIIMKRLEKHTNQSIAGSICYKRSFCVNDFKKEYNSYKGNAYGLANTLLQTANLKPKIKSKLQNLFFCGQLTVPGPGIPPALISGKIAANQIIETL